MRSLATLLVALLALGASARAGTEEAPELADAEGDTALPVQAAWGDLLAVWVEGETSSTFTVAAKLKQLDPVGMRLSGTGVGFSFRGVDYFVFTYISETGAASYFYGHLDRSTGNPTDSAEAAGEVQPGTPGYVRVQFPKAHFATPVPDGTTTASVRDPNATADFIAVVFDFKSFAPVPGGPTPPESLFIVDEAEGTGSYVLTSPPPLPEPEPPAAPVNETPLAADLAQTDEPPPSAETPGPGAALVAVAVAGAALLAARRTRP